MQPKVGPEISHQSSLWIAQRVGNRTHYHRAKRDCSAAHAGDAQGTATTTQAKDQRAMSRCLLLEQVSKLRGLNSHPAGYGRLAGFLGSIRPRI